MVDCSETLTGGLLAPGNRILSAAHFIQQRTSARGLIGRLGPRWTAFAGLLLVSLAAAAWMVPSGHSGASHAPFVPPKQKPPLATTGRVVRLPLGAGPSADRSAEPAQAKVSAVTPAAASSPVTPTAEDTTNDDTLTPAPPPPQEHWQDFTVHSGDTLAALFQRAGLTAAQLQILLRLGGPVHRLASLRPGEHVRIRTTPAGELSELRYRLDDLNTLAIRAVGGDLHATVVHVDPRRRLSLASGTLHSSLSVAMQREGVDAATAAAVANIFRWKVNFRRDVRPGTDFAVLYQELYRDDHRIGTGPVLAASLTIGKRSLRAFRFVDRDGEAHYYDEHGRSLTPSLLRTPVHYTRVSSPFSLHRFDPIVHVWRPHYGVDLAAPRGTPIEAAGDGTIKFIGRMAGYGNLVELRNFGPYTTRYAHMLRFAKGLHVGSHVAQGQIIGYVGETGEATGPHLHFEIRVNGKPHNPLRMHLPDGSPIPRRDRARFEAEIRPLLSDLDHPNGDVHLAGTPEPGGPPQGGAASGGPTVDSGLLVTADSAQHAPSPQTETTAAR